MHVRNVWHSPIPLFSFGWEINDTLGDPIENGKTFGQSLDTAA